MSIQYVDEATKPIPPANTWETLTPMQLLDVRSQLQEKAWAFRSHPQIGLVLKQSLERIDALIERNLGSAI